MQKVLLAVPNLRWLGGRPEVAPITALPILASITSTITFHQAESEICRSLRVMPVLTGARFVRLARSAERKWPTSTLRM